MQMGTELREHDISRWDATPVKDKTQVRRKLLVVGLVSLALLSGAAGMLMQSEYFVPNAVSYDDEDLSKELRAALDTLERGSSEHLRTRIELLTTRVGAVEAENKRLRAEIDELLNHDGVIAALVKHVRSLRAENEVTRRDVIEALTQPTVGEAPLSLEGLDEPLDLGAEAAPAAQLLTRAKHTVVTPAAPTEAPATEKAAPAKKSAKVDPEEGATN